MHPSYSEDPSLDVATSWRPIVLDRSTPEGQAQFEQLRASGKVWSLHDAIDDQLKNLFKTRQFGRDLTAAELEAGKDALLDGVAPEVYGRWVYYPWSGRMVHLLGPDEFRELRADRNRPKITREEQRRLEATTVGVVGLSVGNAIAVTMAMEGNYKCLKLADFDELDLSNMNRLRAGVHELSVPKTIIAARQIYEINPYTEIKLYHGIRHDNIHAFFHDSPRIDVLVDECDSFDIKFPLREYASRLGIPVLMEVNDRGLLDIERYDLEPDRPFFHGLCAGISPEDVAGADVDIKTKALLDIMGLEQLSPRLAVSMFELKETVANWPQLASCVALGGATVANAVRRIVLGEPMLSGRRYIDIDPIVGEPAFYAEAQRPEDRPASAAEPAIPLDGGSLDGLPALIRTVVEAATLAPNPDNNQPWDFYYADERLWMVHDRRRSQSLADSQYKGCLVSFGAAIENLSVAAAHAGQRAHVELFPVAGAPDVIASFTFSPGDAAELAADGALYPAIAERSTYRLSHPGAPLSSEQLARFEGLEGPGACLELMHDREAIARVAELLGQADLVRFLNPTLNQEFLGQMRWSQEEAERTLDGIDIRTLGLTPGEFAAMRLVGRRDVIDVFNELKLGGGLRKLTRKAVENASSVGVITIEQDTPLAWLEAGRVLQRVWLNATALGIGLQPLSGVVIFVHHLLGSPQGALLSDDERAFLERLRAGLEVEFASWEGDRFPAFVFRLTRDAKAEVRALRYPLEAVVRVQAPSILQEV